MGIVRLACEVENVRKSTRKFVVPNVLVDTGAEFTWMPQDLMKKAGIRRVKKDVPFTMANGQVITRSLGYAIVRAGGFETVDEVVFGEPGDLSLLGARTLEGFGALVDSRSKRLVASGPHPAASVLPLEK